jgi:hypothetical protein
VPDPADASNEQDTITVRVVPDVTLRVSIAIILPPPAPVHAIESGVFVDNVTGVPAGGSAGDVSNAGTAP